MWYIELILTVGDDEILLQCIRFLHNIFLRTPRKCIDLPWREFDLKQEENQITFGTGVCFGIGMIAIEYLPAVDSNCL